MKIENKKFRVEILATNGKKIIRLLWYEHLKYKGIYASVFDNPWNLHFSYPKDGNVHVKQEIMDKSSSSFDKKGYLFQTIKGPPLNKFKGSYIFIQGGMIITDKTFEKSSPYNFKKVDRAILVDIRKFSKSEVDIHYYFDLIEPNNYQEVTKRIESIKSSVGQHFICEHHCYFELNPWLIIHLSYKGIVAN